MAVVVEDNNEPNLLIATLPVAASRLLRILPSCRTTVPATFEEARHAIGSERFTLAIVGVYFDGARMFELMSHLRISPLNRACPILCVLGVRNGLPLSTVAVIRQTVNVMENCEFLDMSVLPDDERGNADLLRAIGPRVRP